MTAEVLPPIRHARTLSCSGGTWSYDTWGSTGRPVLLIHSVLFDRAMWWPVAAELHRHCTPIAVDLPGHGQSPARDGYDPQDLITEMGALLFVQQAPFASIVVGHGSSAGLANLFAQRFPTRAIVLVDPHIEAPAASAAIPTRGTQIEDRLAEMKPSEIPTYFQELAKQQHNPSLLREYSRCIDVDPWEIASGEPTAAMHRRPSRLAIYSQTPDSASRHVLRMANSPWRYSVYGRGGRFPHLTDVERFAADIRAEL